MVFDEINTRRVAIVIAGLLIWVLHSFVRLALFPLLMLEGALYYWGSYLVMTIVTGVCAFYLLVVLREGKFLPSLGLALTWLVVYALAEYIRHYYATRELAYPVDSLPRLLLAISFIPLAALGCGVIMEIAQRRKA